MPYPNGWEAWNERVKQQLRKCRITSTIIFTSEKQDHQRYAHYFGCTVRMVDETREYINVSATQIRHAPYVHWNEIAKAAQPFFVKRICIPDHPNLPNAAAQFATIFNTVCISHPPKDSGVWMRASRQAYRYLFTNILLQNVSGTVKDTPSRHKQRPWLLPTDWVIPTHEWLANLDAEAVFCRIVQQLESLRSA